MKLPQQYIPVSRNVITFSASNRMAGVEPSGRERADAMTCQCVAQGKFFVPAAGSCRGGHTQCYNNGTCKCVPHAPANGGIAQNQAHVYNAIAQMGLF
ncbi:MAG: hypothetical protein Kow00121_19940 [Elainellaceae cyanobacterium]